MHPDQNDIDKYLRGELSSSDMHRMEKKALSDPFLRDALEGANAVASEDFSKDVELLNRKINQSRSKQSFFTPLRIAAGIALVAAVGFWLISRNQPEDQLAQLQSPETENASTVTVDTTKSKKADNDLLALSQQETPPAPPVETKPAAGPPATTSALRDDASPTTVEDGGMAEGGEQGVADEILAEETVVMAEEKEELARAEKRVAIDQDKAGQSLSRAKTVLQEDIVTTQPSAQSLTMPRVIRGQVKDAQGENLPGVNVTVKGTTDGTVTDGEGNYTLTTPIEKPELIFSFIGLQTAEVAATDKKTVDVTLEEDTGQLSEIVVTGYGYQSRDPLNPVIRLAEPFGGRKAYDNYLEKDKRFPQAALDNKVKGRVTIEFKVETDGNLADFRVLKSLGYGCDEEVIRLVKEGPKWFPSTEDDKPIESLVRVRLKFDHSKAGG